MFDIGKHITAEALARAAETISQAEYVAWSRWPAYRRMTQEVRLTKGSRFGSRWQDDMDASEFTDIEVGTEEIEFSGRDSDNDGFVGMMPTKVLFMTDDEYAVFLNEEAARRQALRAAELAEAEASRAASVAKAEAAAQAERDRIFREEAARRGIEIDLVKKIAAHFDARLPVEAALRQEILAETRRDPALLATTYAMGVREVCGGLAALLDLDPDRDPLEAIREHLEKRVADSAHDRPE